MRPSRLIIGLAAVSSLALSGCGATAGASQDPGGPGTITIGYFPNLTHAPAMVGLAGGEFQEALGDDVEIDTATFDSGTQEIEALFAGSIDIGFIGPSPTVSGWQSSDGQALRVIAGTAANGAALVVRAGIETAADLSGATIATPSLGNTQDVAARYWLQQQGYATDTAGGGDVHILPQDNATALTALQNGDIDGAWVPEPWATRMVREAGAHVLVNEADTWAGGQFVTTNVVVRTEFLERYPDAVDAFLRGLLASLDAIQADPAAAQAIVSERIGAITGSEQDPELLAAAWDNVVFTADPLADTLVEQAQHAVAVGLLEQPDLTGLYRLDALNALLVERGDKEVSGP